MFPSGATVAILESDTILLTLRPDFEVWCMPGGGIEAGESLADAAQREVREETGLEVELTRLIGTYSRLGWRPHHDFLFAGRVIGGSLNPDPHEVLEARFFPIAALPQYMLMGQAHRIQDAISGVTGIVKTEFVHPPNGVPERRAEIYKQRDQSGMSRRDYYLANFPPLTPEQIRIEVPGVRDPREQLGDPMSIDIGGWVEIANRHDQKIWQGIIRIDELLSPNYDMFGCLFGVMNYTELTPPAAERGLPQDISLEGYASHEAMEPEGGTRWQSWMTWAELKHVNLAETALDRRAHQYKRAEDGRLVDQKQKSPAPSAPAEVYEGMTWEKNDFIFKIHTISRREIFEQALDWQALFDMMRILEKRIPAESIRLVVWFW